MSFLGSSTMKAGSSFSALAATLARQINVASAVLDG
jgi:hypothetical protein